MCQISVGPRGAPGAQVLPTLRLPIFMLDQSAPRARGACCWRPGAAHGPPQSVSALTALASSRPWICLGRWCGAGTGIFSCGFSRSSTVFGDVLGSAWRGCPARCSSSSTAAFSLRGLTSARCWGGLILALFAARRRPARARWRAWSCPFSPMNLISGCRTCPQAADEMMKLFWRRGVLAWFTLIGTSLTLGTAVDREASGRIRADAG